MIPCNEFENLYVGETGRSREIRLKEHVGAFQNGKLNFKLVQYALKRTIPQLSKIH